MYCFGVFAHFSQFSMYAWGEKRKNVSFSRVYVCVKAKLTFVSFFFLFIFLHLSLKKALYYWRLGGGGGWWGMAKAFVVKARYVQHLKGGCGTSISGCPASVTEAAGRYRSKYLGI